MTLARATRIFYNGARMILLFPYEVRTLHARRPWANYALLVLNALFFYLLVSEWLPDEWVYQMILDSWYVNALLGHQFLHADLGHLIGNLVFLRVFGNAVAGVLNNFLYFALYLTLGVAAAAAHLLLSGGPAIGASGAISGLIGFYVAVYPLNRIHCFYLFVIRWGNFDAPGYLLIILWFGLNLFNAFTSSAHIAYWAHVGGAVAGFVLGLAFLKWRLVDLFDYDNPTTFDYLTGRAAQM